MSSATNTPNPSIFQRFCQADSHEDGKEGGIQTQGVDGEQASEVRATHAAPRAANAGGHRTAHVGPPRQWIVR